MKQFSVFSALTAAAFLNLIGAAYAASPAAAIKSVPPQIEVCFVLDTTGSMGGLIEGAKQKIWSIANEIVKATPAPELKVGLVPYRDRGDVYITRTFPLTDDIDTVYAHLMEFRAEGGGDEPESVNEALAVAVNKIDWSPDPKVLKMIFLVGDAPPHMDYPNDVLYPVSCQQAVKRDIIINTVQCGNLPETTPDWKKIASLGEGPYASIGETGDIAIIATPMDASLAQLNIAIGKTLVPYGNVAEQREVNAKQSRSEVGFAVAATAPAASDRLAYNLSTAKAVQGSNELVNDYKDNPAILGKLTPDALPAPLQGKTTPQIIDYLKQQQSARTELQKRIADVSRQRENYLADARKKQVGSKDSFDGEVAKILREEAAEKGLHYD